MVAFRKGYVEINPNNKAFSMMKSCWLKLFGCCLNFEIENTRVGDQVAPLPGEIILFKKRFSAFAGSDLEVVLRSLGI